jgi:hypothetical protein
MLLPLPPSMSVGNSEHLFAMGKSGGGDDQETTVCQGDDNIGHVNKSIVPLCALFPGCPSLYGPLPSVCGDENGRGHDGLS